MRLLILSDLHLEVWGEQLPTINLCLSNPDVVVLAGDIHTRARAPAWASRAFPNIPVIYIAGNHEFYGETIESAVDKLLYTCEAYTNVHFLNCSEHFVSGIRFLGATLWTDFDLLGSEKKAVAMSEVGRSMNDYHRIRVTTDAYRKLRPSDTARLHVKQREWLARKLDEPFSGRTVVVTHMAPSRRSITQEHAKDLVSSAYSSNLDALVKKADVWIHGHTHTSFDYHVGKCHVVANPLGYLMRGGHSENKSFNPNFVIRLDAGE